MRAPSVALVAVALFVSLGGLLAGCPSPPASEVADAGGPPEDLAAARYTVGPFADCTPPGAGYSDARCAAGLRCAMVQVTLAGSTAALTQCVPVAASPIKEGEPCDFVDEATPPSPATPRKRYDRCAEGTSCVPGADGARRCRRLCELRVRGDCKKGELCALPTPVSGIGFCQKADPCDPVTARGCPKGPDGKEAGCYVLGDDKGAAALCWPQQPYGDSTGALDSACERSWHCQSGHSCASKSAGREPSCRPFCTLPVVPDGGTPPDLGDIPCTSDLGVCRAISGIDGVGRCL